MVEEVKDLKIWATHLKQQLLQNYPSILISSGEELEDKEPEGEL